MSGKLPLVLVASLALVSLAAAHSVEKRQTTVSKSACHDNIFICVSEERWEKWIFTVSLQVCWVEILDDYWVVSLYNQKVIDYTWFLFCKRNCRENLCRNPMIELIRYEDTSKVKGAGNLALIALTGRHRLSPILTQLLTIYWKTIQRKFLAMVFCNHHFLGNDIWTVCSTLVSTRRLIPPKLNKPAKCENIWKETCKFSCPSY